MVVENAKSLSSPVAMNVREDGIADFLRLFLGGSSVASGPDSELELDPELLLELEELERDVSMNGYSRETDV